MKRLGSEEKETSKSLLLHSPSPSIRRVRIATAHSLTPLARSLFHILSTSNARQIEKELLRHPRTFSLSLFKLPPSPLNIMQGAHSPRALSPILGGVEARVIRLCADVVLQIYPMCMCWKEGGRERDHTRPLSLSHSHPTLSLFSPERRANTAKASSMGTKQQRANRILQPSESNLLSFMDFFFEILGQDFFRVFCFFIVQEKWKRKIWREKVMIF